MSAQLPPVIPKPSPASGAKTALHALPAGFISPFTRVQMEERMDDAFACIATLTNRTLAQVNEMAVSFGYPAAGPAHPTETLIAKLLMNLGSLVCTKYKDFVSIAALPDVALLFIDWNEEMACDRAVVWHHVRGSKEQTAFSYVIDPASWVAAERFVHTDIASLKISWYVEVRAAGTTKNSQKVAA